MTSLIPPTIKAVPNKKIVIPEKLWLETWLGLRMRGKGKVETAAVWGGKRNETEEVVEAVYFLDDYHGGVRFARYHKVSTEALEQLFNKLHRERRVIVGDIHTHPGPWVGLSDLDMENPIEFRRGLCAVVLPRFGLPEPSLDFAGVHLYEGDGEWRSLTQKEKQLIFSFTQP